MSQKSKIASKDRRQSQRFDTTLDVQVRFMTDGTPISGAAVEIGPNGMRILTPIPLIETSYVHVSFLSASNNTNCEGRVVWTQKSDQDPRYESGIDIQKWGGNLPGEKVVEEVPKKRPKKDRRKKPR